jgi:SAM-dependent methyltransferase
VYPTEWHALYGDMTMASAKAVTGLILDAFSVASSLEVGCGYGHWTRALVDAGVSDVFAVDGEWTDRSHLLFPQHQFRVAELSQPLALGRRFDLAVCLEVAEHVAAQHADVLVRSLVDASDLLLFGAAIPYQGGAGHINEQWPSWWRAKFDALGYEAFDIVRPRIWSDRAIHYWYRQNTFVYVSRGNASLLAIARELAARTSLSVLLFDAVHPEKFEEVASYESLAPKRLLRRLPSWLANRLRTRLTGIDTYTRRRAASQARPS